MTATSVQPPILASPPVGNPAAWFGPNDYPTAAQSAGAQGRVVARLQIAPTGRVLGCEVSISSGDADLDDGTCRLALTKGTFTPARDSEGHPVASSYTLPVRWILPQDAPPVSATPVDQPPPARRHHHLDWHLLFDAAAAMAAAGGQVWRNRRLSRDAREALWMPEEGVSPVVRLWRRWPVLRFLVWGGLGAALLWFGLSD